MNAKDIDVLVGKNLKRLRRNEGLTQDQLGEKIGVDGNVIAQIEGAVRGMGKSMMTRLCNALKIDVWEFYVTEDAPILIDQAEKDVVQTFREARPLGCAEEISKYSKFLVRDAKDMQKRMKKK